MSTFASTQIANQFCCVSVSVKVTMMMVAFAATFALTLTLIASLTGVRGREGSVSDTLYPEVTFQASLGRSGILMQPLYSDQVAMMSANASFITLDCSAPYPVEWDLPDYFSLDAESTWCRGWPADDCPPRIQIFGHRRVQSLWNTSMFEFSASVKFWVMGNSNQICKQVRPNPGANTTVLATVVNASPSGNGNYFRFYSNRSVLQVPPPRPVSAEACNFTIVHYKNEDAICCRQLNAGRSRNQDAGDFVFANSTCTYPAECQMHAPKRGHCVRTAASGEALPTPTDTSVKCLWSVDLQPYGQAGVAACGRGPSEGANFVSVQYFTSDPLRYCVGGSAVAGAQRQGQHVSLYVDVDGRSESLATSMLTLCPLRYPTLYVGEKVELECFWTTLGIGTMGIQFVLKRNTSHEGMTEDLLGESERGPRSGTLTEASTLTVLFNDTGSFEVVCVAPIRDSFAWTNKSLRLTVKEPTPIKFESADLEELVFTQDENGHVFCRASGDPAPQMSWVAADTGNGDGILIASNDTDPVSAIRRSGLWDAPGRDVYVLRCLAQQERLGSLKVKDIRFRLQRPQTQSAGGALVTYVAAGAGAVGAVLIITLSLVSYFLWRVRDRLWYLNGDECVEFFHGKELDDSALQSVGEAETNAWNFPYDSALELTARELRIGSLIGAGEFAKVYRGLLRRRDGKTASATTVTVAVKKNISYLSVIDFKALLFELKLLAFLGSHDNVVKLLGARTGNVRKRQVFLVLEYCAVGDLKSYLVRNQEQIVLRLATVPKSGRDRSYENPEHQVLAIACAIGLMDWTLQILKGLLFLGSKRVVHGDLAARNVLLDSSLVAKISDFGMSHQLTREHYIGSPNAKKAWPSTAPECLEGCEFSVKSDVYSFGVLLWELFSLGDDPWVWVAGGMKSMLEALHRGEGLPMPTVRNIDIDPQMSQGQTRQGDFEVRLATDDIYERMSHCQRLDPAQRPTFQELHEHFEGLVRSVTHLVAPEH